MNLFKHSDNYIVLPDQEALSSLPSALYGHIEKRSLTPFGWRWRKRAVILNPSGHLIIYKYFLKDIGAGRPFVGRVIHLDAAQHIQARMNKDTELRIKGAKARLWAAKVFLYEASLNGCKQPSIEWPVERPLKVLDSKTSTSSIFDLVRAAKVNRVEEFSKATIASLSSESFPDYTLTDSDISDQKTQLSAKILDMEQIRKVEAFTACRRDSESSSIESISVENATTFCGKFTHKKFETNGRLKRSKSAPEFTIEAKFFIAKEANKYVSLGHLNAVLISRQDRLRKHFRNMVESRFYDNLIHPYNALLIKAEIRAQCQQRLGALSPLPIDINCKLQKELKNGDKDDKETVYHF
ncbi:unnamed protein product [Litomosoides sigmodontis]|uniref:PH-15 domain-containing protein n=1 Tax=Litomosoides sigmodontis TaxID=42156 RepID=A0A3P6SQV6_LITSI|nr:unnamed protein product [Litomosoides sigmodontis]